MGVSTISFLFFFFVVFLLYYAPGLKGKQWMLLLLASLLFYGSFSPVYLIFLFVDLVTVFWGSRLISVLPESAINKKRIVLTCVVAIVLGQLFLLKYASMFGVGIASFPLASHLVLPIGLSFYSFQVLAYCIDVYRGLYEPERNFARLTMCISYFPQILQGPLSDYKSISSQLFVSHEFNYHEVKNGGQRVLWGFVKKVYVANTIGTLLPGILGQESKAKGLLIVVGLFLYSFQLYADFSGYMDIILGCSQMLGICLAENFMIPYFSTSITEFWRRWHITLGVWFKNYLFYPLLRSRILSRLRRYERKRGHKYLAEMLPTVVALLIVWILIGLWHGSAWSFVLYGLYHGSFIILATVCAPLLKRFYNRFPKLRDNQYWNLFRMVRTFLIVMFGYILFVSGSLRRSGVLVSRMFSGLFFKECVKYFSNNLIFGNLRWILGIFLIVFVDFFH